MSITDNILNNNESDVDCGGPCDPCINGKKCRDNSDCQSNLCEQGICKAPSQELPAEPPIPEFVYTLLYMVIAIIVVLLIVLMKMH